MNLAGALLALTIDFILNNKRILLFGNCLRYNLSTEKQYQHSI